MKQRNNIFLGLILLLSIISCLGFAHRADALCQVNVLTHTGWIDSIGYYHVSGEVQNVGGNAAGSVKITATFYDSSNTVVATDFTYTALSVIPSGKKSPFEILLIYASQAEKVDHYSLSVFSSDTSPFSVGLQILSDSYYVDTIDYLHIVGEIKNIATGTATSVKVIATFYDIGGNVVATDFTYSDPNSLAPSETAPFHVILIYKNRVPLVSSYVLTAESNQYSMIPEFSSFIILTFIMIAALSVLIVRRKQKN